MLTYQVPKCPMQDHEHDRLILLVRWNSAFHKYFLEWRPCNTLPIQNHQVWKHQFDQEECFQVSDRDEQSLCCVYIEGLVLFLSLCAMLQIEGPDHAVWVGWSNSSFRTIQAQDRFWFDLQNDQPVWQYGDGPSFFEFESRRRFYHVGMVWLFLFLEWLSMQLRDLIGCMAHHDDIYKLKESI